MATRPAPSTSPRRAGRPATPLASPPAPTPTRAPRPPARPAQTHLLVIVFFSGKCPGPPRLPLPGPPPPSPYRGGPGGAPTHHPAAPAAGSYSGTAPAPNGCTATL